MERDLSGPDSAALDRAKVRTTSAASRANSYRSCRPRARRTAAIGAKCREMSANVGCAPRRSATPGWSDEKRLRIARPIVGHAERGAPVITRPPIGVSLHAAQRRTFALREVARVNTRGLRPAAAEARSGTTVRQLARELGRAPQWRLGVSHVSLGRPPDDGQVIGGRLEVDVPVRGGRETDDPSRVRRLASRHYGMGGLGNGATPQIADAQDGSGGVGMRTSFPWVDAVPPNMHVPVNVSRLGKGVVKPSVRVCRKATIWFSCRSVKARLPVVMSRLFLTSGIGQQFTFSTVPGGQCPDVTGKANRSRVL